VVQGEIQGYVVTRALPKESPDLEHFIVVEGKDILAIDRGRLDAPDSRKACFSARGKEQAPFEGVALQRALSGGFVNSVRKSSKGIGVIVATIPGGAELSGYQGCAAFPKDEIFQLLGQLRKGYGWATIVPAIEVRAGQGVVTIPIQEITPPAEAPGGTGKNLSPEKQIVLTAKTVAVVARDVQEVPQGAKGLLWKFATKSLFNAPGAAKALAAVEGAIAKEGRLTVIADPEQADLIFAVSEHLNRSSELVDELMIFKGGKKPDFASLQLLWWDSETFGRDFLVRRLHEDIKKAEHPAAK
jgi:hypothetical protein